MSGLIHIGLPKTGTTFLQTRYFGRLQGINYLGRASRKGELFEERIRPCIFEGEELTESDRRLIRTMFSTDRYDVISCEALSSGRGQRWNERPRLLKELTAAEFRVLIVIRQPIDYMRSWFGEYTKNAISSGRRIATFDKFFSAVVDTEEGLRRLRFGDLADAYSAAFGRDQVLVLPFELLKADVHGFFQAIDGFCQGRLGPPDPNCRLEKTNSAISRGTYLSLKIQEKTAWPSWLSRCCARAARRLGQFAPYLSHPITVRIDQCHRARIAEVTHDQCLRVSEEWGLNLQDHGYFVDN